MTCNKWLEVSGKGCAPGADPKTFNKEEKFFAAAQVWGESNTTLSGGSIEVDSLKFPETKVGFGKKANSLARSNFKRISCCTNSFALQKALKSPTLSLSNQMHLGFKVEISFINIRQPSPRLQSCTHGWHTLCFWREH